MIDEPNDVETVGHDAGVRKVLAHHGPVNGSQIHADDFHQMLAFEPVQIALQRSFAPPEHDIMDFVVSEIAEGSGVAVLPTEEVLVDAEDLRTLGTGPFSSQLSQPGAEPALNGGAGNSLPFRQAAAADAIEMLLANRAAERLTGAHPGQYARKTLPESALAGETPPLAGLQHDHTAPHSPAFMARPAKPQIFDP